MSETINESLEKEFELERIILFSDAVFAIAITLLILEIKFPQIPENLNGKELLIFFKPTIIHFSAFIISFCFIGMSWSRHLQLCKFLKQYNKKVIFFNLLSLFFIVTFPFSISAFIDNLNTALLISILIYLLNIFFVTFSQFLFSHYILKKNTLLSVSGYKEEKKYFYIKSVYSLIMTLLTVFIIVCSLLFFSNNKQTIRFSLYTLSALTLISRPLLKKYKPKNVNSIKIKNDKR